MLTVVLVVFTLFFIIPVIWLLIAITKSGSELAHRGAFEFGSVSSFRENWDELFGFQDGAVLHWFVNSVYYSVGALVLTVVVSIPAGYALAMVNFRGRRTLLVTTLVVMLIPNTALVLPIFLEMNAIGLIGTPLSVILPYSFYPFGVFLTFIYFSTAVPLQPARSRAFGRVQRVAGVHQGRAPAGHSRLALVGFFSFVQNWNNYFLPFVMLPLSDRYPIQVGLSTLLASTPAFNPTSAGAGSVTLSTLALATVFSVLPVLIVFLFSQRFLVTGMTAGGTKE